MRVDSEQSSARWWVWALMSGLSVVTGLGDAFQERVYPLLETHCFRCHGEKRKKGGVDLAHFNEAKSVYRDPKLWEKVLTQLNDRSMPPDEEPSPSAEEVEVITRWIEGALENPPADLVPLDSGSKPVHRLGRIEYNNTLRDLLGVTNRPADRFPSDGGGGGGFENNAETLFLPPLLLERYLATAAEAISQAAPERLYRTRPVWYSSQRLSARDNLRWFARLAFRRPVQEPEVQRLLALYDRTRSSGVPYESALKTAYKAILVSPHFLFRVEIDPPGKALARISDHELAVRLSYFLWSSMPDEALFRVAEQGQLGKPEVLEQEVRRMLRDPKASALAESFAGQWFGVRNLTSGPQPDRQKHPEYTESLRDAIAAEPVAFFNYLVQSDRPLTELIDADYAFVNSELAKHYGLTNPPKGVTLSRVILPIEARQQGRGGLVGMGAVLVQTSYPRRSSPVLRGKWLLEEVLGTPPPPPPPLVKTLSQDDKPRDGLSFRQRLEEHRKNPSCVGCHQRMDPLGFALENFDATGRWRRDIGGELIDSKGTLASGETVDGPVDLKRALMARKALFLRHMTEKMLAYALGRGLEFYDMPMVKHISDSLVRGDARATELILDVVRSYPFQYRRGADALAASSPSGH